MRWTPPTEPGRPATEDRRSLARTGRNFGPRSVQRPGKAAGSRDRRAEDPSVLGKVPPSDDDSAFSVRSGKPVPQATIGHATSMAFFRGWPEASTPAG